MVSIQAKESVHRVMEHCRLTFLFLLPLSNLFHCFCHVLLSLKHPNKSFFNPINIFDIFYTLYYCFIIFSLNVKFIFYRKTRRRNHKEENFRVWYLSQKFASLKRKSQMRRYWVVWKADHNDLAATKRLIGSINITIAVTCIHKCINKNDN